MRKRWSGLLQSLVAGSLVLGVSVASAWAAGVVDPLDRPAMAVNAPAHAVLLDVTRAGHRLVAVGERGIIILSDDGGKTWRQAKVPTSVSLTAVEFPSPTRGWAVGHAGIVLHTEDGGETWTRQLDGVAAAHLALKAAQAAAEAAGPGDPLAQRRVKDAQRLVDDGPDKPFLDLAFEDGHRGIVVGAYNLIFRTEDGGRTWQSWMDRIDNPRGLYLYAIRIVGKTIYLAGEQGLFLRSTDDGEHFTRLKTPYEGTYFALTADASGRVVLAGLRGHAYWSVDEGTTFQAAAVPMPLSFSAITRGEGGTLYFANQAGLLLVSRDQGHTLQPVPGPNLPPLASLIALGPKELLTVGWGGVIPVSVGAAAPAGGAR